MNSSSAILQPKIISPMSCIKVPVPPMPSAELAGNSKSSHLKRSNFTNLAQYLSGSPNSTPPPLAIATAEPAQMPPQQQPAKRRKTTPRKHEPGQIGQAKQPQQAAQPPAATLNHHHVHYSGSTSSLTASPASPPHSHSTEGGDGASIEDTDR